MNPSVESQTRRAIIRMILGAIIGFSICGGAVFLKLLNDGWIGKVPCSTPPPGLLILMFGTFGAVIGALLSLFSRKWGKSP